MPTTQPNRATGTVFQRENKKGDRKTWYAKYRLPDGRQIQKSLGPHWSQRGVEPPDGYYTKALAEAWLADLLGKARRGELPGMKKTGRTFSLGLDQWLEWKEDRGLKHSTLDDYSDMVARLKVVWEARYGDQVDVGAVTTDMIEQLARDLRDGGRRIGTGDATTNKYLRVLGGFFKWAQKTYALPANPVTLAERRPGKKAIHIELYSIEEVNAICRKLESETDKALILTAAMTGLRLGELLALRWGDVNFTKASITVRRSYTHGVEDTPKSGESRTVPMVPEVGAALNDLSRRDEFTGPGDLVFVGPAGLHLGDKRLRQRYYDAAEAAGLRRLVLHSLRHTFGSVAIQGGDLIEVQHWMGHADPQTTAIYLQFRPKVDAAERLSAAFARDAELAEPRPAEPVAA
jgi:integrase